MNLILNKNKINQLNHVNKAGFTLIEMLVSLSIFTIVVTISVGTVLVLIDANGRARNMQVVMTKLSFALDSMTRDVRTGTSWYCGNENGANKTDPGPTIPTADEKSSNATKDCTKPNYGNYISIIESGSSLTDSLSGSHTKRVTYWFNKNYYGVDHGAILRKLGGPTGSDSIFIPLTGDDVDIDTFRLVVSGTDRYTSTGNNIKQPTLTLFLKGRAGFSTTDSQSKDFSLETTITQRLLDI